MTPAQRVIIAHAKRIRKLEADLKLANARIAVLESRPIYVMPSWPTPPLTWPPTPEPLNPFPMPYVGDPPMWGGNFTVSTEGPNVGQALWNGKPIELTKEQS